MNKKMLITGIKIICIIAVSVFFVFEVHKSRIEQEFEKEKIIIKVFWENEDLFEQVKDQFIAPQNNYFYAYYDRRSGHFLAPRNGHEIGGDLGESLLNLYTEIKPPRMKVGYNIYYEYGNEKEITFLLNAGIKPKGIVYLTNKDHISEEELKKQFRWYDVLCQLKNDWYYYECLPNV